MRPTSFKKYIHLKDDLFSEKYSIYIFYYHIFLNCIALSSNHLKKYIFFQKLIMGKNKVVVLFFYNINKKLLGYDEVNFLKYLHLFFSHSSPKQKIGEKKLFSKCGKMWQKVAKCDKMWQKVGKKY